jgi:hypothetical protein
MLEYAIYVNSPFIIIVLLKRFGLKLEVLKFLEIAAWEYNVEALKSLILQTRSLDVGSLQRISLFSNSF